MKKWFFRLVGCLLLSMIGTPLQAQLTMGNTGLLHMPTADMQRDGTILLGGNYLNKNNMPSIWNYNTYNYFVSVTFLPFVEVSCTCNLMSFGVWGKDGKRFNNQDRSFSGKIRLLKENQFWKYMPAVVVGTNDPVSGTNGGGDAVWDQSDGSHNYFARYYVAATKHIEDQRWGVLGCHLAYVLSRGTGFEYKGLAVGLDYRPAFHKNIDIMAEYDARTFNCGLQYDLFKYFICTFELQDFKYISAGLTLRLHLKREK